jgi:hypothetical protein
MCILQFRLLKWLHSEVFFAMIPHMYQKKACYRPPIYIRKVEI